MTAHSGPQIKKSNVSLFFDPKNTKNTTTSAEQSLRPDTQDHGISEWVCMVSGTITYSAPYSGTTIFYIDADGNHGEQVAETTSAQQGTFSGVAGWRYYGSKAISFFGNGGNHRIVPLTLAGKKFGSRQNRGSPGTIYFYAPYSDSTVSVYDGVSNGIAGTATSTVSVPKGTITTYTSTNISSNIMFQSTEDIVVTGGQSGSDFMIIPPVSTQVYRRRDHYESDIENGGCDTASTYYVADSKGAFTVEIADAQGGDGCQGLGKEYLADTYTVGHPLSDYHITAPYPNTRVTVYYQSNGRWKVLTRHKLNGSETNPAVAFRDGNTGPHIPGNVNSYDGGNAAYFAGGATHFLFRSNNPIHMVINDTADDEEMILGWMRKKSRKLLTSNPKSFRNLFNRKFTTAPIVRKSGFSATAADYVELNGSTDYIEVPNASGNFNIGTGSFTMISWVYPMESDTYTHFVTLDDQTMFSLKAGNTSYNRDIYFYGGTSYRTYANSFGKWTMELGKWQQIALTREGNIHYAYYNGDLVGSLGVTAKSLFCDHVYLGGDPATTEKTRQRRGPTFIYDTRLSHEEIKKNWNAYRGRYGLR